MEPPKKLDISTADYLYGLRCCSTTGERDRKTIETELEELWGNDDGLTALSVRTGFDAFLTALRLPKESQVLMSAVTIPDMVKIVEAHGLVPIAIDIDYDTLEPRLDLMQAALNPKTKLLVVSHVFGTIVDMNPLIVWAHENGLLVIEDCAEAYCGPRYRGHDKVDISLFSFGTIKTETALGGALMRVQDETLRNETRLVLESYAVQPLRVFSGRIVKYMAFGTVLNNPKLYAGFVRAVRATGRDHLEILLANSRGFIGQDLFQGIRLRPPVALLYLLKRRLINFDADRLDQRREICAYAAKRIRKLKNVKVPGAAAAKHYYWLFPINVEDPERVSAQLLENGFDATAGTTSLMSVDDAVTERCETYARVFPSDGSAVATKLMSNVLYLPIDASTSKAVVDKLVNALDKALNSTSRL